MAEGKPPTSAFSESASTPVEPEAGSSAPTDANRPTSARRPRTGARRPNTKRVATPLEGLGDLPDQQFYPEGDDFDEDDEFDDEEPDKDVFAFERPATSAVPNAGFSDYTTSVPGTSHLPTTAGTSAYPAPTTAGTHVTGGTFGFGGQGVASPVIPGVRRGSTGLTPPGAVDVGGHIPELAYDINNPPPFSGRQNPNNSAFAFAINARQARDNAAASASSGPSRPHTGRSLFNRMQRKKMGTATTAMTGTSHFTTTEDSRASFESEAMSETGSYASGEGPATRPANATRRMRSSQPLISGADSETALTSEAGTGTRRGMSRGSYGMTELTGDMTVPDGKTTWGDGMGGMAKDSEVGEEAVVDFDMAEEDSPYAEVRASVSNIDDPDMPGEYSIHECTSALLTSSSHHPSVCYRHDLHHSRHGTQYFLLPPLPLALYLPFARPGRRVPRWQVLRLVPAHSHLLPAELVDRPVFLFEPRPFQHQGTHYHRHDGQRWSRSRIRHVRHRFSREMVRTPSRSRVQHLLPAVHATHRVRLCWSRQAVCRLSSQHDLAWKSRHCHQLERFPCRGRRIPWWYEPSQILARSWRGGLRLVLPSRSAAFFIALPS